MDFCSPRAFANTDFLAYVRAVTPQTHRPRHQPDIRSRKVISSDLKDSITTCALAVLGYFERYVVRRASLGGMPSAIALANQLTRIVSNFPELECQHALGYEIPVAGRFVYAIDSCLDCEFSISDVCLPECVSLSKLTVTYGASFLFAPCQR